MPSLNTSPSESSHNCKSNSVSILKKQNKMISQNNKKFFETIVAEGLRIPKWKMNCYFQ